MLQFVEGGMWKKICVGSFVLVYIMFASYDLGSINGGPTESKESVFSINFKPSGFDSLVLSYDEHLRHVVDSFQSPGAAVAIVYKGEIILLKGYGIKKAGGTDSVDMHTAFRLGSVSKGFAAVLTGILEQEGYVSWDDHVKKYLPDFQMKDSSCASQLTIRHILSHTSGFPEHTFTDLLDNGYSFDNIKNSLGTVPLAARPGKVYGYQNVVYSLIGDILQKATGIDYNSLLKQKIFDPLQMHEASTDFATFNNTPNTAYPHLASGKTWKAKPKNDRYYSASPASGVNASASDMAQWLLALTGYFPDVVSHNTIHDISMVTIQTPRKYAYRVNWTSLEKTYYGLGWRIFQFHHHEVVYHGGYVEGFRTEIAFDPAESVGIVVLFNSNTPVASHCIPDFFGKYYNLPHPDRTETIFAAR
jgi:beta-lactamase class C